MGVAALVADDPASAAFPGTGGVIVFASNQPAPATAPAEEQSVDFEIYSMQADGTQLTQLTDNSIVPPSEEGDSTEGGAPNDQGGPPPGMGEDETTDGGLPVLINDLDPAVSPDGKTIAFTSNRPAADGSTDNEIYLMNLDGTDVRQVTNQKSGPPQGNAEHELAWSPDGDKLVFRRGDGVNADLYILNLATKQEQKLNTPPSTGQVGPEGSPAWSPDGKTIAFTKGKGPAAGVWTYDVPSGLLNELANQGEVSEGYPNWSPDGKYVLFTRGDDSAGSAIWQIEVATGVQKQLSNLPVENALLLYSDSHPAFSWDGTKIAFQSTRDGNMKPGEGETTEGGVPADPAISARAEDEGHGGGKPEVEFDTGNVEIYVMNADGTGQTRLTSNGGVDDPATELVDESKAGPKDQMPDWSGTPLPKPVIPAGRRAAGPDGGGRDGRQRQPRDEGVREPPHVPDPRQQADQDPRRAQGHRVRERQEGHRSHGLPDHRAGHPDRPAQGPGQGQDRPPAQEADDDRQERQEGPRQADDLDAHLPDVRSQAAGVQRHREAGPSVTAQHTYPTARARSGGPSPVPSTVRRRHVSPSPQRGHP